MEGFLYISILVFLYTRKYHPYNICNTGVMSITMPPQKKGGTRYISSTERGNTTNATHDPLDQHIQEPIGLQSPIKSPPLHVPTVPRPKLPHLGAQPISEQL